MICGASHFFYGAFKRDFQEAASKTLRLPEDTPEHFEYLLQYLYSGSLAHEKVDTVRPNFAPLLHLYILGDKYGLDKVKNAIVDRVTEISQAYNVLPNPEDVALVYNELRETAPIRQLILDLYVQKKTDTLLNDREGEWDNRFLIELIGALKRSQTKTSIQSQGEGTIKYYEGVDKVKPKSQKA